MVEGRSFPSNDQTAHAGSSRIVKNHGPAFRLAAAAFGVPTEAIAHERVRVVPPGIGEVMVRMLASPINPSDLIPVTGAYRHRTHLPYVPGFEGVGIVEALGEDVRPDLCGQRVLPLGSAGCWQTWKTLPAHWCVRVPDDLPNEQAATAYVNPLTALLMVRMLDPRPGQRIGITAAGSAIGRMLIAAISARGASPVAVVRSAVAREALADEPADVFLEGEPLPALAAGLDAVGGTVGAGLASAIRPGGPLVHYGLLSGVPLSSAAHAALKPFSLRDVVHAMPRATFHATMAEVFAEVRSGRAATLIAGRHRLDAFRDALEHDAREGRRGKILLCP